MVAEELPEFERLIERGKIHDTRIAVFDWYIDALSDRISRLEVEITEHRAPAEELNDDLHNYVGHKELQLEIKDNGYALTRNGVPASQLSEGEITAIAVLYFLKSLTDHRFDLANGAVVLDDPVSSLDANSLFLEHLLRQVIRIYQRTH